MATYTIRNTSVQDWRDTMMSKAEFNAIATERRANRAGSGFDEFGKHFIPTSARPNVNEGISTDSNFVNFFALAWIDINSGGTSKTNYPLCSINGSLLKLLGISSTGVNAANYLTLPPAPTVLPYDAVLTQQQIDSGVIKHADASNSGLIVNGKFDTDTSGWTSGNACTLSVSSNKLLMTATGADMNCYQLISGLVVGKKYIVELYQGTISTSYSTIRAYTSNGTTLISGINGVANSYNTFEFIATQTSHRLRLALFGGIIGSTIEFDNIAVFPADAISRSDLCFLESWHEDVSEKDFVYPLGNVQYLGTTGDSGTPVAGAFAGSATYSLFSDTWQADGALVGKGYVWSTLSDANKKAFVANPENNCYLDGDKVIQVRYRMRVVAGDGDLWRNVDAQSTVGFVRSLSTWDTVFAKGKNVSLSTDVSSNSSAGGTYQTFTPTARHVWIGSVFDSIGADNGRFVASGGNNVLFTGAYEGKCFALPIALVHRRNQGAYHPVYNSNGSRYFEGTDGGARLWYENNASYVGNIAVCFTKPTAATVNGYSVDNTTLEVNNGYIGTTSGRADGLFYDQVHEGDIIDLRMSSQKVEDYNRLIDREFNKLVAGTVRGSDGEWSIVYSKTLVVTKEGYYAPSSGFGTEVDYAEDTTMVIATGAYLSQTKKAIAVINGIGYKISNATSTRMYVQKIDGSPIDYRAEFAVGDIVNVVVATLSTRTKSNTLTHTDIIGSPANYPLAWKQSGVSGVPLIVAEDGTSLLPTGTTGSDGLAVYKLSRKANATPLQVLKSTDSGVTWTALTVTTHYTFNTTTNTITFTAGNIPLVAHLVMVTYQTHTVMLIPSGNSEVLAVGDAWASNHVTFGQLVQSTINKVAVSGTSPVTLGGYSLSGYRIDGTTLKFGATESPSHSIITPGSGASPTVKVFPYLTRSNGKAYLQLVFKEMKFNVDWGDDSKFNIVDNVSTTVDDNSQIVLIGQKRIELPYFISAGE